MNRRTLIIAIIGVVALVAGIVALVYPYARDAYVVYTLVDRNVAARGGADAWSQVESLRYTGTMEIGQGMEVPFVLEQARPARTCLQYEFDGEAVIRCSDGERGWKVVPFKTGDKVIPLTADEVGASSDAADPRGLLMDYGSRGHQITYVGLQQLGGRDVEVLKVTLPSGAEREVYLDATTTLEVEVVSSRDLARKERRVTTRYGDWKLTDGLLIPMEQVTQTEGDDESHTLTVKRVTINPTMDEARFGTPPATAAVGN
jgi:hypothetical protein